MAKPVAYNFPGNGFGWKIYGPEPGTISGNSNIPIVVSFGAVGGTDLLGTQQEQIKSEYGEDVIIVYLSADDYRNNHDIIATYRDEAYDYIERTYGIDFGRVADAYTGHSLKGSQCVIMAAEDYKNYQDSHNGNMPSKSPTFFTLDARRGPLDGPEVSTGFPNITQSEIEVLKNAGARVLAFNYEYPDYYIQEIENTFIKNGIDCVLIQTGYNHDDQGNLNVANGAIQLSLGYTDTMLYNLNDYRYVIPKRDSSGNVVYDSNGRVVWERYQWSQLSEEDREYVRKYLHNPHSTHFDIRGDYHSNVKFSDFNKLCTNLSGLTDLKALSNDQDYVVGLMNAIRNLIKSTTLVSAISSFGTGCTSTTQVPTKAENLLYDYQSAVLNLLDKLSFESEKAISVGQKIDDTDRELQQQVQTVYKTVYVPISNNSTPAPTNTNTTSITTATTPTTTATTTPTTTETETTGIKSTNEEIELKPYNVGSLINKDISKKVYNITADDLNRLFDHWADRTGNYDSPLRGTGESWIKACEATNLDPLTLLGICGEETGRGGFNGMGWMTKKNFFGMLFIDPTGDGCGASIKWGGVSDPFATVDDALLASCKRIKNFYCGQHGGSTVYRLAHTGYTGYSDKVAGNYAKNDQIATIWGAIMKEALDYITGTNGGVPKS